MISYCYQHNFSEIIDLFLSNNPTDEAVYEDPKMNTFAVYEGDITMDELDLTIGYGLDQPQNRAILVIGKPMKRYSNGMNFLQMPANNIISIFAGAILQSKRDV